MLLQMAREHADSANGALRLSARIHDASAGVAIGIGLLKGWTDSRSGMETDRLVEVFEQVQAQLKHLSRTVPEGTAPGLQPTSVRNSLERVARTAGVQLELKIIGRED